MDPADPRYVLPKRSLVGPTLGVMIQSPASSAAAAATLADAVVASVR